MLTFLTNAAFSHCCCQYIYLATFEVFARNFCRCSCCWCSCCCCQMVMLMLLLTMMVLSTFSSTNAACYCWCCFCCCCQMVTTAFADNGHAVNFFAINAFDVDVVDGNAINPVAFQWQCCQIFAKILSMLSVDAVAVNDNAIKAVADNGWCRQYCRCHRCC